MQLWRNIKNDNFSFFYLKPQLAFCLKMLNKNQKKTKFKQIKKGGLL